MIIYPAIDLRQGRCVRLQQGDVAAETVFAQDPVEMALRWATEGAQWLHVVNLDGALGESAEANLEALRRIRAAVALDIQFGGGLRSVADVSRLLAMGVQRAILGTVAVRQPEVVAEAIARFGAEKIAVGIDARDGKVAIHGWLETSSRSAIEVARQMRGLGVARVIYTDVGRDGMLSGINVAATLELAREARLGVIASGGVASLDDIRALLPYAPEGIEGVIVGMALYRGAFRLLEALQLVQGAQHVG
jgi:phosphoribosylformimino-5-aminoimidazole carboxamide ribotide isomerase